MMMKIIAAPNEVISPLALAIIEAELTKVGLKLDLLVSERMFDARKYKEVMNSFDPGSGERWAADCMKNV